MSGCHVLGERYLEIIANNQRQVCTWNMNAHQIGENAILSKWDITKPPFSPRFESFKPEMTSIGSYLCRSKFACQKHDDKVFKVIDDPKTFDAQDSEHQFRLALRAIAGTAASAEGTLAYCVAERNKYRSPGYARKIARHHNIPLNAYKNEARSRLEKIDKSIKDSEARSEILRAELLEWQQTYKSQAGRPLISRHMPARTRVRVAISSVTYQDNRPIATYTVLPRPSRDTGENLCDIILTCRRPKSRFPMLGLPQSQHLEKEVLMIEDLLDSGPGYRYCRTGWGLIHESRILFFHFA